MLRVLEQLPVPMALFITGLWSLISFFLPIKSLEIFTTVLLLIKENTKQERCQGWSCPPYHAENKQALTLTAILKDTSLMLFKGG